MYDTYSINLSDGTFTVPLGIVLYWVLVLRPPFVQSEEWNLEERFILHVACFYFTLEA